MDNESFEPKIVGFLCNWCCYAAADSAGVARFQYPPNIRAVRIMCTGRMDPLFIIDALSVGADGVFVGGWQLGECHYQVGNYDAIVTAHLTRKVMEVAGVRPERLALEWASAAEAPLYVELITKFTEKIKELGPLGEAEGIAPEALKLKLLAARSAVENVKLRTRFAKLAQQLRDSKELTPELIQSAMAEKKVHDAIIGEVAKQERAIAE